MATAVPIPARRRILGALGPGMIWAMSAIGQTHLVVSTTAGAKFGFALVWVVVLAHVIGYPVFEYGARYAVVTGESLIEAYVRLRRLRRFMLPFFGFLLLTLPFVLLAGLLSVAASLLLAAFPGVPFAAWCVIVTALTAVLIFGGHYRGLEAICLGMSGVLLVGTVVTFGLKAPEAAATLSKGVGSLVPAGSLVVLVALMRLPSDPASSIMLSAWAVQKRGAWLDGGDLHAGLRQSLFDLRLGYALSLVVAVGFLALGAVVLHPRRVDLEGIKIALTLSDIYTQSVGAWAKPVFILVGFTAIWGSFYSAADGVPRMFVDLFSGKSERKRLIETVRIVYTLAILGGALLLATVIERPLFLVLLAVSAGLIAYPLIYALNIYAVTRMLAPEFRPPRWSVALACLGFVYACTGATLLVLTRILGVGG